MTLLFYDSNHVVPIVLMPSECRLISGEKRLITLEQAEDSSVSYGTPVIPCTVKDHIII
jgi:hypothetical protein